MHILIYIKCLLAIAVAVAATYDTTLPAAEVRPARHDKVAILITPVRRIIDFALHRRTETPENERDTLPWSILSYPAYANVDNGNWSMHLQGNLFKYQPLKKKTINRLANAILFRASIVREHIPINRRHFDLLNATEAQQMTRSVRDLAVLPIKDGIIDASIAGCDKSMTLPTKSNVEGSFHDRVTLPRECFGKPVYTDEGNGIKSVNMTFSPRNVKAGPHVNNTNVGKVFFVPPQGLTIVLDIDDILRDTLLWNFKQTSLNIFARRYQPWKNMPDVLWNLKRRLEAEGVSVHFHYLTNAPELFASRYINGTRQHYPDGSFDFRMLDFGKTKDLFNPRKANTIRLLDSFPERRFIFFGDTASGTTLEWTDLTKKYPAQIQCLLIRDVQKTQPSDWWTPNTREFLKLLPNKYWFYQVPDDLGHLSASYLASLSLNQTSGCSALDDLPPQSLMRNKSKWIRLKDGLRILKWHLKCSFMNHKIRPNRRCPLDRIPGKKYRDGSVQEEIQADPLTWWGRGPAEVHAEV